MPVLDVEGHPIYYTLHTPPHPRERDPLLILAHPFTNSSAYWEPQLHVKGSSDPTPLALRFNIATFDAPGHGRSAVLGPKGGWDYWLMGRVMLELCSELGFTDVGCVIVGDSQGGYAGLRAALDDAASKKNIVKGLVSCGSSADPEDGDLAQTYIDEAASGFVKTCHSDGIAAAVSQLAAGMAKDGYDFDPSASSSSPDSEARRKDHDWGRGVISDAMTRACHGGKEDRGGEETKESTASAAELVKRNFETLVGHEGVTARLGEVQCPALVIHGKQDHAYPFDRENWKRMHEGLKDSELEVYDDGPHFITVTHAEQINPRIIRFVDERVLRSTSDCRRRPSVSVVPPTDVEGSTAAIPEVL